MHETGTDQDGTTSTKRVPYKQVTVAEAAEIRGVSVVTIRRMIKRGELEAERVIRPQGSAYLVNLPEDGTGTEHDVPFTEQPAQNMFRAQGTPADQMMSLIETTITSAVEAAITPLVKELATTHQTVQQQAEVIGSLRTENAALLAAQARLEAQPEPTPVAAILNTRTSRLVPLWRLWPFMLALAAALLLAGVLVWPR
jgi:excisionase family DNA binding protein